MLQRAVLLPASVVLTMTMFASPRAVEAAQGPMHIAAQRDGLRLELVVPLHAYPRNAFIRVYAYARNVSRHTVWIVGPGPMSPGQYVPQVQVLDAAARSLPVSLTSYFPYTGPVPFPLAIKPGESFRVTEEIVLRGAWLRREVMLLRKPTFPLQGREFHPPVLGVRLLPSDAPAVHVSVANRGASAILVRPPNIHGSPWAVWYADCGGTNYDQQIYWTKVTSPLSAGCFPLVAWHVLVGWRGHSVATIEAGRV